MPCHAMPYHTIHTCMHVYIHIYIYILMYIHMHAHTHIYIYIYITYIHVYIYIYIYSSCRFLQYILLQYVCLHSHVKGYIIATTGLSPRENHKNISRGLGRPPKSSRPCSCTGYAQISLSTWMSDVHVTTEPQAKTAGEAEANCK